MLTVNNYNRRMLNIIKRTGLGYPKNRTTQMFFHNGVFEVPFPIEIKGLSQWAIYHKIDENYDFDWETIRAHEEKNPILHKLT